MKGLALPQMTTLVLAVIAIAIVIILVFITFFISLTDSEVSNMYNFIVFVNRPYDIAEILYQTPLNGESFFNDVLRVSLAGSAVNSSSNIDEIRFLLDLYDIDIYSLSVIPDEKIIEELGNHSHLEFISNNLELCGEDNEGYCVLGGYLTDACGVGRVEIDDAGKCGHSQVCCMEDEEAYSGDLDIYRCGPEGEGDEKIGICTYKQVEFIEAMEGSQLIEIKDCGAGRLLLDDEEYQQECEGTNEGNTPICCVPFGAETQSGEMLMTAEIPLLFKGRTLFEPRKYYCLDVNEANCEDGYFVAGMCTGPSNHRCCITDTIRCKPPYEDGYCVDENSCGGDILADSEYCPEPERGISRFVCCDTEPDLGGGNERDPDVKGICGFDEDAYNSHPLEGLLDITLTTGVA